ncbi:replication initiator protein A [Acidithiobacillus sp. IBUN Pt1247-S3]|uniref:replication initiator protein A n=1 Tax=Acidithiobacillus sp. IBUN Pt1247-S3 TaxID=3166642 RepID=UPI0034E5D3CD
MGNNNQDRKNQPVPLGDALAASLARLGETVRARTEEDTGQMTLLPGDGVSVGQDADEGVGAFVSDAVGAISTINDSGISTEDLARHGLDDLRDIHRLLSERMVAIHHELAQVVRLGNRESSEASALHEQLATLQAQRDQLNVLIEDQVKARRAEPHAKVRVTRTEAPGQGRSGLIKVRHPNRDFFLADLFDYALKDDGASMEAPIFTLATKPDLSIWEWRSKDGNKSVKVTPSVLGRATMHDKDVLIYVCSQMVEGLNRGRDDAKNRTIRFVVYDLLVATNRDTSGHGYKLLHETFERLRGTSITTDIRTGGQRVREGFGIIDRWKIIEKSRDDERMIAVEITLSEWLYNAVHAMEVLTIHPNYFRLRRPLARRLYELARKHCGHQAQWKISLELLQTKSGSKSTLKEFRRMVRAIETENSLPEYRLVLSEDDTVTFHSKDAKRLARAIGQT